MRPSRFLVPLRPGWRSALAGTVAAALFALAAAASTGATGAAVWVFPIPGDPVAAPATQITFRGIPVDQLGQITVTGSRSGVHAGRLATDSDGDGGSFLPNKPFSPGERVTVQTSLNVEGSSNGTFSFRVAVPAPGPSAAPRFTVPRVRGDVGRYRSAPSLAPALVRVDHLGADAAPGDVFVAPQAGPVQYGPMILDPTGGLIWFHPLPKPLTATDFRVQSYQGQPVLTWWQGNISRIGTGLRGVDEIFSNTYRPVATVRAGNGLSADLHEFQITPQGTALVTAYYPVYWDARSVRGSRRQVVLDGVVQEIDIPTGLVLFQWDSLSAVPLNESHVPVGHPARNPFDYFHVNSIQLAPDGTLVVSARNTWVIYDLDANSGAIRWRLGGRRSSFRMGPNTTFAFQHDARLQPNDQLTVFDDGAGPPAVHRQSRALTIQLDLAHRSATLVRQNLHHPSLLANFEGNVQTLPNGDQMVGWGQRPYFTEFNPVGEVVWDGHFVGPNTSYRAYRFPWSAAPAAPPGAAVTVTGGKASVYASWNGATQVASWQVLGGASPGALVPVATAPKSAFETAIALPAGTRYVAVRGLDAGGNPLGTSRTLSVG